MYDSHMHSTVSFDSFLKMEDAAKKALDMGFKGITFTEHIDLDDVDGRDNIIDFNLYDQEIAKVRELMQDKIKIFQGVEIGLQPHLNQKNHKVLQGHNFDFIIGSVHSIDGIEVFNGEFARGKNKDQAYKEYLQEVYNSTANCNDFHVLGHLDMLCRNVDYADRQMYWQDFAPEIDKILNNLIERDKGIEINTAAYYYGLENPHPSPDIIKRYKKLGGTIITCGSDCHTLGSVGRHIKNTYSLLEQLGFNYINYFENGEPKKHKFA